MVRKHSFITRDISWLSFNARVLQEAKDPSVHVFDRLRFIGIFSNNLDEFFRVRVATLRRMARMGKTVKEHLEKNPEAILDKIQEIVLQQQKEFDETYASVISEMERQQVYLLTDTQLNANQRAFVRNYFDEKLRTEIVPLMIESMPQTPPIHDKSIYLACVLGNTESVELQRYALIEVPTKVLPRFVILPSEEGREDLILLEDIIRFNLPTLFAPFGFNRFLGYIIKITRDAELEIGDDVNENVIAQLEKSLKNRKKGRATRFVYDRNIDEGLFSYLTKRLNLSKHDNMIPGGRIHNFKDFMDFPYHVFTGFEPKISPIVHPKLKQPVRLLEVLDKQDILLHFPYHRFDSLVDLLREAAIDPNVYEIKITAYRLAKNSKIVNALINAVRNGKQVTVILELRARFDEEANLYWKERLEEEGVKVFLGVAGMKVHAKLGLIKKREWAKQRLYGFVSTGNFNENTARYYGDHCLLTTNKDILGDINKIFHLLEQPKPNIAQLAECKTLVVAPVNMRERFMKLISTEIKNAQAGKEAFIILKMNSLVDRELITKLYEAAEAGVKVDLIIRGICCVYTEKAANNNNMYAISIIDEYLEHARVFVFHNNGKQLYYISSADWMVRNLDHRIEAAVPITNPEHQKQLMDILQLQLAGNVKARILDDQQENQYVPRKEGDPVLQSQDEIYSYITHLNK